MAVSDPVADMLTMVRNAYRAQHENILVRNSKVNREVIRVLHQEGYINSFSVVEMKNKSFSMLNIVLKYDTQGKPVVHEIKKISKPGRRMYAKYKNINSRTQWIWNYYCVDLSWCYYRSRGTREENRRRAYLLGLVGGSMSRIGRMPVVIPNGVTIEHNDTDITVKGPKGQLSQRLMPEIVLSITERECVVTRVNEEKRSKQMHGLYRQLINNMVVGVSSGFEKRLQLVGVGYRAEVQKSSVIFSLGYSMPIEYAIPENIEIVVEGQQDTVIIRGISKEIVGKTADEIRSLRKPEPYKGKGIRYSNEIVRRKEGKSGAKK